MITSWVSRIDDDDCSRVALVRGLAESPAQLVSIQRPGVRLVQIVRYLQVGVFRAAVWLVRRFTTRAVICCWQGTHHERVGIWQHIIT